jgi:hypothetical protein
MKHALAAAAAFVVVGATEAAAQNTAAVTATVTVAGRARLDVSAAAINFADADPTATPSIQADVTLNIQAQVRTAVGTPVTLTVEAATDFTAGGGATIGIAALSWTTTGAGYAGATAALAPVTLGSWAGPGARTGTQTYFLANSWDWAPGTYTTTLNYTLSTP